MTRIVLLLALTVVAVTAWAATTAPVKPVTSATLPRPVVNPAYKIHLDRPGALINWVTGQLEVVGKGYATGPGKLAQAQARATAMAAMLGEARRFLPTVLADSRTPLTQVLTKDPARQAMNGLLANLTVVDEMWNADRRVATVVGVLPIWGEFGLTYLGMKALDPKPIEVPVEKLSLTRPIPRGHTPQRFEPPYSGVIINAETALLTPCLFPRLLRFDGRELWGPSNLKPAAVITGPIRYAVSVDQAIEEKLAGERPLILQAVGNGQGSNPVLNLDDVYLVLTQEKFERLLEQLPLIVTLGKQ
jgi:hypothetical protein